MTEQATAQKASAFDELRQRYRQEQQKRIRTDGMAQWRELGEELDQDPFVDPGFTRDPLVEDTTVVVVGGGFAGMLTAIDLVKHGITDFRIVEKAGDFGGTWYWNRYPGCMCDVESYVYLPLLEETGYMPTERYASATEIFDYCRLLAQTFDLYPHALFQTDLTGAAWNENALRWQVTTSRDDRLSARFLVLAGGILHKAKLPGIPGIDQFEGKAFHTSRWDYRYTGGGPNEPMDQLADKRVGIIGTGATGVQVVPQLARAAKEVFVFQRTPSAVGIRNQQPTDVQWFQSLEPGWQHDRIINFTQAVTGAQPEVNMVNDGWTEVMWVDTQRGSGSKEEAEALERVDFEVMEAIRQRVDAVVDDPETAERLKPYWGKHCKRVCFHDDYLASFNRPNVHLVDTEGRGVDEITARGPVVDGVEYPVDLLIYASGFEVTTDLHQRLGFDPKGVDGAGALGAVGRGRPHAARGVGQRIPQPAPYQPRPRWVRHELLAPALRVGSTRGAHHRGLRSRKESSGWSRKRPRKRSGSRSSSPSVRGAPAISRAARPASTTVSSRRSTPGRFAISPTPEACSTTSATWSTGVRIPISPASKSEERKSSTATESSPTSGRGYSH